MNGSKFENGLLCHLLLLQMIIQTVYNDKIIVIASYNSFHYITQ